MFDTRPNEDSTEQAARLLASLRDLDGIWGAFVLSAQGELLLWDVPRSLSERALDAVAPRVAVLRDALSSGTRADVDFLMLRYANHRLCVGRATPAGIVCVIATPHVNLPALRTAMTVTARRLGRLIAAQ